MAIECLWTQCTQHLGKLVYQVWEFCGEPTTLTFQVPLAVLLTQSQV